MTPTYPAPSARRHRTRPARRWAYWPLRVAALVETVLVFDQAVYAGQFLGGDFAGLGRHQVNARVVFVGALALFGAALLLWRPGGGPGRPAVVCATVPVAVGTQISLGKAHVIGLHVPLGVAIIAASLFVLVWSWRLRRPAPDRPVNERPAGATWAGRTEKEPIRARVGGLDGTGGRQRAGAAADRSWR
jgi:hypothetical protein